MKAFQVLPAGHPIRENTLEQSESVFAYPGHLLPWRPHTCVFVDVGEVKHTGLSLHSWCVCVEWTVTAGWSGKSLRLMAQMTNYQPEADFCPHDL